MLAVVFIGIAAFFLWRGNYDALFISAVVGAVCFFLSYRFQVGERIKQRATEKQMATNAELTDSALIENDDPAGQKVISAEREI